MSETRAPSTALAAALSGPAFEGAASRSALHASERHVERWAPEGPSATRSRGLRSLAFADRVATPWMTASSSMHPRTAGMFGGSHQERSAPGVSWLFPRPWFQDELDWMAAARQSAESTPQFLTTRGTYASARTSAADVVMPVVAPELVVPSMMASGRAERASASPMGSMGFASGMVAGMSAGAAPVQQGLRAWSPSVPFAAAAAAEVVAGAVSAVSSSGLAAIAERSPLLAGLTMVAPASLSGHAAPRAGQAAASEALSSSIARMESSRRPDPIAPSLLATVTAARAGAAGDAASAPTVSADGAAPTYADSAVTSTPATVLSPAEQAMSTAIGASPAMAGALRAMELLVSASTPSATAAQSARASASASAAAASSSSSSSSYATPTSSSAYAADTSGFAPVVGPRVAMPAGLGGLAAAIQTAHTISQPFARTTASAAAPWAPAAAAGLSMAAPAGAVSTPAAAAAEAARSGGAAPTADGATPGFRGITPGWAPVWAQPQTALASVAQERARAVDHLAWSDRWLARFAGASSVALTALDVARGDAAPTPRLLSASSPEVVYVHPELGPARLRAAIDATRQVQPISERAPAPAPVVRPSGALRIDDSESTPDSVFAALFAPQSSAASAAAAASRAPAAAARRAAEEARVAAPVERPPVSMVDAVRGGARPTAADLISISAPTAPDAGLSPGLASSPMAAAISSVLPLPQAPVFDPRSLYAGGMATAYLSGLTARAAAPVGVLASAPTAGALASVARFGDVASAGGAMGGWALRDLALAPMSLRLAEAAPERTMIATGGDVDVVIRGGGGLARGRDAAVSRAAAPSWTTPTLNHAGPAPTLTPPADLDQVMLAPQARAPLAPTGAATSAGETVAPSSAGASTAAAASALPAIEPELLALRSALLASPTAASAPLAHSFAPLLLSSAMSVPGAGAAEELFFGRGAAADAADLVDAEAPVAPRAQPAMPVLTLPSVGGAMPSPVAGSLAGHAGGNAFVPPSLAAMGPAAFAPAAATSATGGGAASGVSGAELAWSPAELASGRPGALAEQALRWSVAEERSSSNLSFDFVTPEMVLAAKVYGLPPGAAAEASRLAVAGPSALASLATSLDLTFLRSFQQASAAPGALSMASAGAAAPAMLGGASAPAGAPSLRAAVSRPAELVGGTADDTMPATADLGGAAATMAPLAGGPSSSSLAASNAAGLAASAMIPWDTSAAGESRAAGLAGWAPPAPSAQAARTPRGAFLWPAGAVNALGLRAQGVDGVAGLPVVALELLAAQAVADLGTWVTAFPGSDQTAIANALRAAGVTLSSGGGAGASIGASAGGAPSMPMLAGAAPSFVGAAGAAPSFAGTTPGTAPSSGSAAAGPMAAGPAGADDAELSAEATAASSDLESSEWAAGPQAAGAPSVAALRARFQAVYVAMSRSPEGMSLSPSARAARAMAVVAGRDGALSPRARAAAVWSVMPQVYQGDLDMVAPAARGNVEPGRTDEWGDARPGLAGLAARAGEALGSFVSPHEAELGMLSGRRTGDSLAARAGAPIYVDTARPAEPAQEAPARTQMQRPGRAFSQVGGGEPEIPSWFEGAARKMLEDRSGGSSGMSLAELVLVTAMPARAIAASGKSASAQAGSARQGKAEQKGDEKKPDVNKLAAEVYAEVLKLIDSARERSGDPYQ